MSRGAARDVRVEVAPGSIGVKFDPDYNGNAAVVKRFVTLPSGQDSPLKRHVSSGWVLIEINDTNVSKMKHKDVLRLIKSSLNHRRTLIFRESSVHYAQHDAKGGAARKTDTVNLDIEVTQFRLNRNGSKQFGEYEVLCTLKKRNVAKNKLLQWAVWQRYSRFQILHKSLTAQYGYQMKDSKFPPKRTFGSLAPDFMEQRRRALDLYMHYITQIRNVTEFNKEHLSSKDLRKFIDYDEGLKKLGVSNIVVEPGGKPTSELRTVSGEWNGTNLKLFAFTMAIFLPGIDYSTLGWIKPRNNKQILLGIGIFLLFAVSLASAICAPLAFAIWLYGIATVAYRANNRIEEIGGFSYDIRGKRVNR